MKLNLFKENYAVCKLNQDFSMPICVDTDSFYYITNFKEELSIICKDEDIPSNIDSEKEWKILNVKKNTIVNLLGLISNISNILKLSDINNFKISTKDNEYILIKNEDVYNACKVLKNNGYEIIK